MYNLRICNKKNEIVNIKWKYACVSFEAWEADPSEIQSQLFSLSAWSSNTEITSYYLIWYNENSLYDKIRKEMREQKSLESSLFNS